MLAGQANRRPDVSAGCSTSATTRLAMKRAVLTAVPVLVTSLTSMMPRRLAISTRRPARVAVTSYVWVPSPESMTISTRSPFMSDLPAGAKEPGRGGNPGPFGTNKTEVTDRPG